MEAEDVGQAAWRREIAERVYPRAMNLRTCWSNISEIDLLVIGNERNSDSSTQVDILLRQFGCLVRRCLVARAVFHRSGFLTQSDLKYILFLIGAIYSSNFPPLRVPF